MHLTSTAAVRNTLHSQAEALQTAERLQDYMFFTCEYVSKNRRNWIWTFFLFGALALHYSSGRSNLCMCFNNETGLRAPKRFLLQLS